LSERIAPAVHAGFVSLNLVVEHSPKHHYHKEHKIERSETIKKSDKVGHSRFKFDHSPTVSNNLVSLPMDKPTIVTAPPTDNNVPVGSTNPVYLPMDKPPVVTTLPVVTTGPVLPTNPIFLPMDKPPIVMMTASTTTTAPTTPTEKVSLPMDKPSIAADNVEQALLTLYQNYEQDPSSFSGGTSSTSGILVQGDQVGIDVHDSNAADFQTIVTELTNAGMNITLSSATDGMATGMLPISELLAVAQLSQSLSINPEWAPVLK
jgi:hypothetical protein